MYVSGASVEAGGLISYGSDIVDQYHHRVAYYVDKILKARSRRICRWRGP